jgi:hypothetical protein
LGGASISAKSFLYCWKAKIDIGNHLPFSWNIISEISQCKAWLVSASSRPARTTIQQNQDDPGKPVTRSFDRVNSGSGLITMGKSSLWDGKTY